MREIAVQPPVSPSSKRDGSPGFPPPTRPDGAKNGDWHERSERGERRRCLSPLFALLLIPVAVFVTSPLFGDAVVLRNGQRIEGKVRIKGDKIEITTADNKTVTVTRAEVDRIEAGPADKPADFEITDALRRRAEQHRRLKALAGTFRQGGVGAARAAKELTDGGPDAVPFLTAALADDDTKTVRTTIQALGTVGVRAAADAIADRLTELKPALQVAALAQLGEMRAVHAVPSITALLRQKDTRAAVKQAAVRALGRLQTDLAVPALIRALGQAETNRAAAEALVSLDSPSALPYLGLIVTRNDQGARAAAKIISKIARAEHVPLLLRLKKDDSLVVREAAASALKRLKDGKGTRIATHIALLKSKDRRESDRAKTQLEKLAKHDGRTAKAWIDWWVKQNEARLLVVVIPIGDVDPMLVRVVEWIVAKGTGIKTLVAAKSPLSKWGRIPGSRRYRGDALLEQIERWHRQSPQVIAAIGITNARLEMPGFGAVIGAFRYGRCGLISVPGLEAGQDARLLKPRLARYAQHVAARALRVTKAEADSCPAAPVFEAAGLDRLGNIFSAKTVEHIKKSVSISGLVLAGELDAAIKGLSQLKEAGDPPERLMELGILAERSLNLDLARRFWLEASKSIKDAEVKALLEDRVDLIEALAADKN